MNWFVFFLFFVSGASGLIYEVVWSRMMTLVFGRSVLSVGIVLAAFMSGMALGSYALGKYADRSRNPLRLYALYEIGVGLTAFAASLLLARTAPVHIWIHTAFGGSPLMHAVVRFLMVFALLILPTTLMGATLPILSRVVVKRLRRVGEELGSLYAVNTAGAVGGSLAAGFYLIGRIGLHGTVAVAVFGNLVVGIAAWAVSSRSGSPDAPAQPSSAPVAPEPPLLDRVDRQTRRLLLWAFALSGLASFSYEIFWTRSLVFLLGNTTYAFTLMLTAFLLGIALGGYGVRFLGGLVKNPLRLFAAIEMLIGVFSAVALPLLFFIVRSDAVHSFIARYSGRIELLAASNFVIALSLMLLPATLIGATLPLMGRIFVSDLRSAGTTVGKIYAMNTLGNVTGALLPGLLVMPLMGIQKGILLMAALNASLGIALFFFRGKLAGAALAGAAAAFLISAGALTRIPVSFQFPSEYQRSKDEVLFYREGGLVTTKVWTGAETGYKELSVDGINIGGTGESDYKQQILAHLPKLLLKSYRSELSVGLGSGILIGESGRHAALKKIACVEISKGVAEGSKYFSAENFNILSDPRVTLVVDDVVDFLQTSTDRYDIISADEKTAGKYATNSFSYSREYYALLKQRLAPGGLVIQWMPADLPPSQYDLAIRTFLAGFPRVQLWYFPPIGRFTMSNTLLVGSNDEIGIDPAWMRHALETDPESFEGIRKYGLTTAEAVLSHYIGSEDSLRRAVPPGPVNTFEEPYYEFYSPGDYAVPSSERALVNHELLMSVRGPDFSRFVLGGAAGADAERLDAAFRAESMFLDGHDAQLRGFPAPEVLSRYNRAIAAAPWDRNLRNEVVAYLNREFLRLYRSGDYTNAVDVLRSAVELYPESSDVHQDYGWMLLKMNRTDRAIKELEQALALNGRLVPVRRLLAEIYASRGQAGKAMERWKEALALDPNDVSTLVDYGVFLAEQQPGAEALDYARRAYRLAPQDPDAIDAYARVLYLLGNISRARCIVRKGGGYYESNPAFEKLRAAILSGN
ncbi:MAG TPA: fused MFS/spermidine synthase [Nitrospirota bacterium]